MGLYGRYQTNKTAEEQGVTLTDLPDGVEVTVRSVRSSAMQALERTLSRKYRQDWLANGNSYSPEATEAIIVAKAVAVTVGWKNVTGPDGEMLPFSKENAEQVYRDLPAFREQVLAFASNDETYRASAFEPMVKTSAVPSEPGSPSAET